MEELCKNARRVAVLEGIVDSTNVGAIFRSAAALNMDAVLINPSCCDPLCRRAVEAQPAPDGCILDEPRGLRYCLFRVWHRLFQLNLVLNKPSGGRG